MAGEQVDGSSSGKYGTGADWTSVGGAGLDYPGAATPTEDKRADLESKTKSQEERVAADQKKRDEEASKKRAADNDAAQKAAEAAARTNLSEIEARRAELLANARREADIAQEAVRQLHPTVAPAGGVAVGNPAALGPKEVAAGFNLNPGAATPVSPVEAAGGKSTVLMFFPRSMNLTLQDHSVVAFKAGFNEVPQHLEDHEFLAKAGVVRKADPVTMELPRILPGSAEKTAPIK